MQNETVQVSTRFKSLVKFSLLSMLRSDWLSYYYAICYSPLVAKSAGLKTKTKAAESRLAN